MWGRNEETPSSIDGGNFDAALIECSSRTVVYSVSRRGTD